jgi:hypothetical protein
LTSEAICAPAAGTLSRPRMLVAATPTTRKHVSAIMVTIRVNRFSVSALEPAQFAANWALNKA